MDSKDQRNGIPMGTFNHRDDNAPADAPRGAGSRVEGSRVDNPDPAEADTTPDLVGRRPARKRVQTLLGVPLSDVLQAAETRRPETRDDISQAIQSMLDEEIAIAVELEEFEDDIPMVAESDLAEYVDSAPPGVLAPVSPTVTHAMTYASSESEAATEATTQVYDPAKSQQEAANSSSAPLLPLLIPSQYAQAQARERDSESLVDTQKRAAAVIAPSAPATTIAATASLPSAQSIPPAHSIPPTPISSLAPREVRRPAAATQQSAPQLGLMMVAAMALIAAGGWWLTAGSFSRSGDRALAPASQPQGIAQPQAVAQPQAAPSAEPVQPPAVGMQSVPTSAPLPTSVAAVPPSAAQQPTLSGKSKALSATSRTPHVKTSKAAKGGVATTGDLPEAPSRAVVVQQLESVRSSVQACAAGRSGVADLDITIAHSGVVTHVLVGGDFAGTMQGSCIARAVREARFPSFKQDRLRLLFPYAI